MWQRYAPIPPRVPMPAASQSPQFMKDCERKAITHESVAHVIFQKYAAQAGKFVELRDRPFDHAGRFVELVEERGTTDMDVDRIGKGDAQLAHLLGARNHDGVVTAGSG